MGGFDLLAVVGSTTSLISLLVQLREKALSKRQEEFPDADSIVQRARQELDEAWLQEDAHNTLRKLPNPVYYAIGRKLMDLEEGASELVLDPEATTEELDFVIDEMRSEICRLLSLMKKINAGRLPHKVFHDKWVKYGCSEVGQQREAR